MLDKGSGRHWGDLHLMREIAAQGHSSATNGTDHVAAIGQLANLHRFTESETAKLVASGTFQHFDVEITADRRLSEALKAVVFQILDEGLRHDVENFRQLRPSCNKKKPIFRLPLDFGWGGD
jgi:hypothetical protein